MSSAIARKKKRMKPAGYKEEVHVFDQQKIRSLNYAKNLAEKTFLDMKLISFNVLHDKFGYGQKRIKHLEERVNDLLNEGPSCEEMVFYLKEKGIDLMNVEIPQRDLMGFQKIGYNNDILPLKNKVNVVLGSVSDYIILSVTALRTNMKFTKKQVVEYIEWIQYYINSISRKIFLDMVDVASVLYHECKYCDPRFIGQFREI